MSRCAPCLADGGFVVGHESGYRPLLAAAFDVSGPGLRHSINRIQTLVRGLRDRVSADAWRVLGGLERDIADFDANLEDDQMSRVVELLDRLAVGFLAFGGVVSESMTRGQSWRFLDMGMRIERAIVVAGLVRATMVEAIPEKAALLDAILEICDSSLTYRRRYLYAVGSSGGGRSAGGG